MGHDDAKSGSVCVDADLYFSWSVSSSGGGSGEFDDDVEVLVVLVVGGGDGEGVVVVVVGCSVLGGILLVFGFDLGWVWIWFAGGDVLVLVVRLGMGWDFVWVGEWFGWVSVVCVRKGGYMARGVEMHAKGFLEEVKKGWWCLKLEQKVVR